MSKEIKITLPTKEDIKPTAKDTGNAVVEASQAVPSLAFTMVLGGADLAVHSVKEIGGGLKSLGSKIGNIYTDYKLLSAHKTLAKHYEEQESIRFDKNDDIPM